MDRIKKMGIDRLARHGVVAVLDNDGQSRIVAEAIVPGLDA
jgi:hypothetical protein